MRKIFVFLNLVGLLLAGGNFANAQTTNEIPVEVIKAQEIGLSDTDESKSLIEIVWQSGEIPKDKINAFQVILFITYADGTVLIKKLKAEKEFDSIKIEVPSVKNFGGKPTAFIKKINAKVTAIISKTTD